MDLSRDFDAASRKLNMERKERERQVRREKLEEIKRANEAKAAIENLEKKRVMLRKEREKLQDLREKERIEKEILEREQREKVLFCDKFNVVPYLKADTNRIRLPHSVLSELESQGALEKIGGPFTFELTLLNDSDNTNANSSVKTVCGVDEFTAEEGYIGIPPAVALSLSRENGVDWLNNKNVQVKLTNLPQFDKIYVEFQPRGDGFHTKNEEVVNIDIKSVLMRTLRDMLTITEGDWIPIRHEGQTYDLIVKKVSPEHSVSLLNTDVEVELLPSENTERIDRERKEAVKNIQTLKTNYKNKILAAKNYISKHEEQQNQLIYNDEQKIIVRIRLPNGKTNTRQFSKLDILETLIMWVQSCLPDDPSDDHLLLIQSNENQEENYNEFNLLKGNGNSKQKINLNNVELSLQENGFTPREFLLVDWNNNSLSKDNYKNDFDKKDDKEKNNCRQLKQNQENEIEVDNEKHTNNDIEMINTNNDIQKINTNNDIEMISTETELFSKALHETEQRLDRDLEQENLRKVLEESLQDVKNDESHQKQNIDKVHVFHSLIAQGIEPKAAALAAQNYSPQIITLETMGFASNHAKNIELLKQYQGRLERVVNILVGSLNE